MVYGLLPGTSQSQRVRQLAPDHVCITTSPFFSGWTSCPPSVAGYRTAFGRRKGLLGGLQLGGWSSRSTVVLDSSRPQPQSIDYKAQELDRLIWSSIPSCFDMFWGSMEIHGNPILEDVWPIPFFEKVRPNWWLPSARLWTIMTPMRAFLFGAEHSQDSQFVPRKHQMGFSEFGEFPERKWWSSNLWYALFRQISQSHFHPGANPKLKTPLHRLDTTFWYLWIFLAPHPEMGLSFKHLKQWFSSWHMGLSENRVYSQWNSHLIGIMISKTIGFRGTLFSDYSRLGVSAEALACLAPNWANWTCQERESSGWDAGPVVLCGKHQVFQI